MIFEIDFVKSKMVMDCKFLFTTYRVQHLKYLIIVRFYSFLTDDEVDFLRSDAAVVVDVLRTDIPLAYTK